VIIVSDGEDPNTLLSLLPWLKKRTLRLQYMQTRGKQGPAAARNIGWLNSRAAIIAFTDDDCIPDKHWLEVILANYEENAVMAFRGRTIVPLPEKPTDFALNTANLERAEFVTANCACTKSALTQIGGFDDRFKMAWREDSDLQFRLLEQGIPIKKLTTAVVTHPVREAAFGVSIKEQKKAAYDALLFRKFPELYRRKIGFHSLQNYYMINGLWLLLIVALVLKSKILLLFSLGSLCVLLGNFVYQRLRKTRKSPLHILEMLSTSLVIPSLSVYWRLYGAVKFRVLFI